MCALSRLATIASLLVVLATSAATGQTVTARPVQDNPPRIIFGVSPAVLILVEGEPVYRDVEATGLQRIMNTRSLIVRNDDGIYYLKIFDGWMESYSLTGRWTPSGATPAGGEVALQRA